LRFWPQSKQDCCKKDQSTFTVDYWSQTCLLLLIQPILLLRQGLEKVRSHSWWKVQTAVDRLDLLGKIRTPFSESRCTPCPRLAWQFIFNWTPLPVIDVAPIAAPCPEGRMLQFIEVKCE
jgi:hypothetical protein